MLTDFGFSRFVPIDGITGNVVMSDTFCGTTSHNPPEIVRKMLYDPFKGDVWCMGVMLFIMLNQDYPFDRHAGKDRMYEAQMKRAYRLRESVAEELSSDARELIDLLLEPLPDKRPTIQEMCKHGWFPVVLSEGEILASSSGTNINAANAARRKTEHRSVDGSSNTSSKK